MSLDAIYEHIEQTMKMEIGPLIKRPTIIEPSTKTSQIIGKLSSSGIFDAFYREKNSTWNINIRDLLQSKNITHMKVGLLSHTIPSLSEGDTIADAVAIITQNRTRAAPVVKNNKVIGIVDAQTILGIISKLNNKWIKAHQILTPNPIVIDKKSPLSTARRIMVSKRIDHLPVVDKNNVSSVLTSYHVLQSILPKERVGKRDIGSKMIRSLESAIGNLGTSRVVKCSPYDDLGTVLRTIIRSNTTFCLVSHADGLQGIITYRDILNLLTRKQKSTIPLFVVGLPKEDSVEISTNKISKTLDKIAKVYPDIQEARVYVKKIHGTAGRHNYEVSAVVLTPNKRYILTRNGFELGKIFNEISQQLLRSLSKRAKQRNKTSIRKM